MKQKYQSIIIVIVACMIFVFGQVIAGKRLEKMNGNPLFQLKINEICSANEGSYVDAEGMMPDWVELYNPTQERVSLAGIGLSDVEDNKFQFVFPEDTYIEPNGYILVCCDGTSSDFNAEGEYYAPFKIGNNDTAVYLTHPRYGELDTVIFPKLEENTTYGRYENGSDQLCVLVPTPNISNEVTKQESIVLAPVFSVVGGFYTHAFDLQLEAPEGITVYYTTDCSDPRVSHTAKIFEESILIYDNTKEENKASAEESISLSGYEPPTELVEKGMVIRAVAKDAQGNMSDVVTNSYFVGKTKEYYENMKVISITVDHDDLFGSHEGIYAIGTQYEDWKNSASYDESLSLGNIKNPTNYNSVGIQWERPANIQVFENEEAVYTTDVGIRIEGSWSRGYAQKSFCLYSSSVYGDPNLTYSFITGLTDEEGNDIVSFDKLILRNGGQDNGELHYRDSLNQSLVGNLNFETQGTESCIVFLNGEFWGLYTMTEVIDEHYFQSHYGIDEDDVTIIKAGVNEDSTTTYGFEVGSIDIYNEYVDFAQWALTANMKVEGNYKKFCSVIDVESFMEYIVVETYLNNSDWSNPNVLNNYSLWRSNEIDKENPFADGKWRFILYETESSTNFSDKAETAYDYNSLANTYQRKEWMNFTRIFNRCMENATFANQFYETYHRIIEEQFDVEGVLERIAVYHENLYDAWEDTNARFSRNWIARKYEENLEKYKQFFINRPEYAKLYLEEFVQAKTE